MGKLRTEKPIYQLSAKIFLHWFKLSKVAKEIRDEAARPSSLTYSSSIFTTALIVTSHYRNICNLNPPGGLKIHPVSNPQMFQNTRSFSDSYDPDNTGTKKQYNQPQTSYSGFRICSVLQVCSYHLQKPMFASRHRTTRPGEHAPEDGGKACGRGARPREKIWLIKR